MDSLRAGALTATAQHDPSQCEDTTDEGEGAGLGDDSAFKPDFSKTGKVVSAFHLVVVAINDVINTVLFFRCVNSVT